MDIPNYYRITILAFIIIIITIFYSNSTAIAGYDIPPKILVAQTNNSDISDLTERIDVVGKQLSALPLIQEHLEGIRNSVYKSSKRLIHIRLLLILIFLALVMNLWILTKRSSAHNKLVTESKTKKVLNNYVKNRQYFRLMLAMFLLLSSALLVVAFFIL